MATGTPKTKVDDSLNQLRVMLESDGASAIDDIAWGTLLREARGFQKITSMAHQGYRIEAYLWALKRNRRKFNSNFAAFASYRPGLVQVALDKSIVASLFNDFSLMRDLIDLEMPDDPRAIRSAMVAFYQSGMFVSATTLVNRLSLMGIEKAGEYEDLDISESSKAAQYYLDNGLNEIEVAKRIFFAKALAENNSKIATGYQIIVTPAGLTFEFVIDEPPSTRAQIESMVDDALVAQFEDDMSLHVSIGVTGPSKGMRRRA